MLVVVSLLWVVPNETVLTGVSSAIFFVPGFLLFIPGGNLILCFLELLFYLPEPVTACLVLLILTMSFPVFPTVYHVIYISCAVRGRRGFKLFYLPYFEK